MRVTLSIGVVLVGVLSVGASSQTDSLPRRGALGVGLGVDMPERSASPRFRMLRPPRSSASWRRTSYRPSMA